MEIKEIKRGENTTKCLSCGHDELERVTSSAWTSLESCPKCFTLHYSYHQDLMSGTFVERVVHLFTADEVVSKIFKGK